MGRIRMHSHQQESDKSNSFLIGVSLKQLSSGINRGFYNQET